MSMPLGYEGVALTRIWPPSQLNIDTRFLPGLQGIEVIHLHEAIAASLKTV